MLRIVSLLALLVLGACSAVTKDLGSAGKAPGLYFCNGQASMSVTGQTGMLSGNGNITFNCPGGAYFGQGYPAASLPTLPNASSPPTVKMPPLAAPPVATTP